VSPGTPFQGYGCRTSPRFGRLMFVLPGLMTPFSVFCGFRRQCDVWLRHQQLLATDLAQMWNGGFTYESEHGGRRGAWFSQHSLLHGSPWSL